jgi:hypothetical protein
MAPSSRLLVVPAALLTVGVVFAAARTTPVAALDIQDVRLQPGAAVHLATPPFLEAGKRYAFTFPGGGPAQTYTVKQVRADGWVLVDVAGELTNADQYLPGEFPQRWLHVALATSIQEMKPLLP